MKRLFYRIISVTLMISLILSSFSWLGMNNVSAADGITIVTDTGSLKEIQTSKVKISMNSAGFYQMTLLDSGSKVFYGDYGGSTYVTQNGSQSIFNDFTKDSFEIKDNAIELTATRNSMKYTLRLSFVNVTSQGAYMKVELESKNAGTAPVTIGSSFRWDTKVNGSDSSPFRVIENGWVNYYNGVQVTAYHTDTPHVVNADKIYLGNLSASSDDTGGYAPNYYSIGSVIEANDTAARFWWNDKSIQGGSIDKVSIILGVGPVNNIPTLDVTSSTNVNVFKGESIPINVSVRDSDVDDTLQIKTSLDGGSESTLGSVTANGSAQIKSLNYQVPSSLTSGNHILTIWAADQKGGISQSKTININVQAFSTPGNPTFSNITENAVTVSWDKKDNISSTTYELLNATTNQTISTGTSTSAQVTGLSPNKNYSFKVRAKNTNSQYTAYSGTTSVYTKAVVPGKPTVALKNDELSITWSPSTNPANTFYKVELRNAANQVVTELTTNSPNAAFDSANLIDGLYSVSVLGKNESGIFTASAISDPFWVDRTAPQLNLSLSNNNWTQGPLEIYAAATDSASGVKHVQNPDNVWVNGNNAAYSAKENGVYTFKAEDVSGNLTTQSITVSNIDREKPVIQYSMLERGWSSESIEVDLNFTDEKSGVDQNKIYYKVTNSKDSPSQWDQATSTYHHVTIQSEGEWYIHTKVTDQAGNITQLVSNKYQIQYDPEAPILQLNGAGSGSIQIEWTLPKSLITEGYKYQIENTTTGQTWDVQYPQNQFTEINLDDGTLYQYRVKAINHVSDSEYSNEVTGLTLPKAPTNLQVEKNGNDPKSAYVSFDPVTSANAYEITVKDTSTLQDVYQSTVTETVNQPIGNLIPGTNYDISVRSKNETGFSIKTHIGYLSLPNTPGFRAISIGKDFITLEWDSVTSATYYRIENDESTLYEGDLLSFTDQKLGAGKSYNYKIAAANETGLGEYAFLNDIWTLPDVVADFKVDNVTSDSIRFTWEPISGVMGYELEINGNVVNLDGSSTSYTSYNLDPGTTYTASLKASNTSGYGESVNLMTSTIPDSPEKIEVQKITENEALILIPSVTGATYYEVEINDKYYLIYSNELLINDLTEGTTYTINVAAANGSGKSPATQKNFVTIPGIPNDIQMTASLDKIELNWHKVQSATSYRIYDESGEIIGETDKTSFEIDNLMAGTEYKYYLAALNENGFGKKGATSGFTLPDVVQNLNTVDIQEHQARIEFQPVKGATTYFIQINDHEYQLTGDQNELLIDGLIEGTRYSYTVKAGNRSGFGEEQTFSFLTLPGEPKDIKIVSLGTDKAIIKWSTVQSAKNYRISNNSGLSIDTAETMIELNDLSAGKLHEINLAAENNTGFSKEFVLSFYTLPLKTEKVEVEDIKDTEATIKFAKVEGATNYKVTVGEATYLLEADQLKLTLSDLNSGTQYSVNVQAGNAAGYGEEEEISFLTLPSKPEQLAISSISSNSVTITWDEVRSANKYLIISGDSVLAEVDKAEATLTELKAGEHYEIQLIAVNATGKSRYQTVSFDMVPDTPKSIEALDISENSALIKFSPVYGALQYFVEINHEIYELTQDQYEIRVSDLKNGSVYSFKVSAGNLSGIGESGFGTLLTLPDKPKGVKVGSLSSNTVTILWEEVESAKSYQILSEKGELLAQVNDNRATLTELVPGRTYNLSIQAQNDTGNSSKADVSFRTHPETLDVKIQVEDITLNGVKITWEPVVGADGYRLYLDGELIDTVTESTYEFNGYDSADKITGWSMVPFNTAADSGSVIIPDIYTLPSNDYDVTVKASQQRELSFAFDSKLENEIFVISYRGQEIYKGKDRFFRLSNLMNGTSYKFNVWTENEVGDKTDPKIVEASTLMLMQNALPSQPVPETPEVDQPIEIKSPFIDIDNSWAKEQILSLYKLGIIKGTGTKFEPIRPITRIEFVSLLVRSLHLETDQNVDLTFKDIDNSEWYTEELKIAVANKVAKGFSEWEFKPNEIITREQASKMLANALYGSMIPDGKVTFSDVDDVSDWAKSEILGLGVNQLVQGYPDGSFRPKGKLTRAESAAMIYRMYDKVFGIPID